MKRKVTISIIGLIVVMVSGLNAQTSNVAYFMKIPQNHFLNPALKPGARFYIGLPVFSGVSLGMENNFMQLTDLLTPGLKADSIFTFQNPNFDLNKLASKLNKRNTIAGEANAQLIGVGFPLGRNFSMMIDISDRFTAKALFPRQLLDLYLTGGSDLINKTINISDINTKGQFFREYGIGVSGDIIPNLRIGARFKLLSGIGSLSFDNRSFSLTVNNDLSQTVTADATMEVAGRDALNKIFNHGTYGSSGVTGFFHDYLGIPLKNPGFSVDLGAVYNFGKLVSVSLSVKDLGFIKWKDDLQAWEANGSFTLSGITLQDVQNQTFSVDSMFNSLIDGIKSNFKPVASPQPFTTYLPTNIIAGGSINPLKFLSLGVLSVSRIYAGSLSESISFSANTHLGQIFSASVAYTIANDSYNNLGLGLAFTAGVAQIYLIADKIPLVWEKIYIPKGSGDYSAVQLPKNFNTVNFQIGVNIVFGKPVTQKTDKPILQSTDKTNQ